MQPLTLGKSILPFCEVSGLFACFSGMFGFHALGSCVAIKGGPPMLSGSASPGPQRNGTHNE